MKEVKKEIKERGITLVALVVTIIILLILAGVTLNIALSENGIFEKAKEAVEKYKNAEEDEIDVLEKISEDLDNMNIDYNDYVGCYVEGYNLEKKTYTVTSTISGVTSDKDSSGNKIADNIAENGNQTFETETGMKWQIWDYDGTTIRLISEKPTKEKLTLKGVTGYNNGIWAMNEIARQCYGQYDNDGKMKKEINVANLKRSDVQKVITYDYTNYSHNTDDDNDKLENGTYKYGSTKTYSQYTYVPKLWDIYDSKWTYEYKDGQKNGKNQDGIDPWEKEFDYIEQTENISESNTTQFKQSYWRHDYSTSEINQDDWKKSEYYNLLFGKINNHFGVDYWIGCRYLFLNDSNFNVGIHFIRAKNDECMVRGYGLYISWDTSNSPSFNLRPIVSIDLKSSGYSLKKLTDNNGTISFKLEKN